MLDLAAGTGKLTADAGPASAPRSPPWSPTRPCSPNCGAGCPRCGRCLARGGDPAAGRERRRRPGRPGHALVRPGPGRARDRPGAGPGRRAGRRCGTSTTTGSTGSRHWPRSARASRTSRCCGGGNGTRSPAGAPGRGGVRLLRAPERCEFEHGQRRTADSLLATVATHSNFLVMEEPDGPAAGRGPRLPARPARDRRGRVRLADGHGRAAGQAVVMAASS